MPPNLENSIALFGHEMLTSLFSRLSTPLFTFVENDLPLRVISYAVLMTLLAEVAAYVMIYRTRSFQQMKKDFETYKPAIAAAANEDKKKDGDAPSSASASVSKTEKKKEIAARAKRESFEAQVGKKMAVVQVVGGVLTMATMIFSIKAVPKIFGDLPAGTLPFEPPAFLQKITQRGLNAEMTHDARDFSPFFIFMLCQSSVRLVVQRLVGLGPSRKMLLFKPDLEKAFKSD